MMMSERRVTRRYELQLPLHYRISQKGALTRFGTGMTCEISAAGLSFRCRKPLPVGAHIELMLDWPAKYGDLYPVGLQATGFVVRSDADRTAVHLTSRKFRIDSMPVHAIRATA